MTETTHTSLFQPLAASPPRSGTGTVGISRPATRSGSAGNAFGHVRSTLARIANRASQRMHEIAPPPQTIHESLGITPRSR